jgi:hypothetical protein
VAKPRTAWRCQTCGASAPRWVGRCAECGEFGTYVEEIEQPFSEVRGLSVAARPGVATDAGLRTTRLHRCRRFDRAWRRAAGCRWCCWAGSRIGKSTLLRIAQAIAAAGQDAPWGGVAQQVGPQSTSPGADSRGRPPPELDVSPWNGPSGPGRASWHDRSRPPGPTEGHRAVSDRFAWPPDWRARLDPGSRH